MSLLPPSVTNASGILLRQSAAPTNWVTSKTPGAALSGTAGVDALFSPGGGASLSGGTGDDTYNLWENSDRVIEVASAGVDTIISNCDIFLLPVNAEILIVQAAGTAGTGNAAANWLIGAEGSQTLNGGAGDDVLTGGVGADSFVLSKGDGCEVITDFESGTDLVVLRDYQQLTNFAAVKAAMRQVGADVVLSLGSETLVFRGHNVAEFSARDFKLPTDLSGLRQTFNDDFVFFASAPDGRNPATGAAVWSTTFPWHGERTLPAMHEDDYFSDPTVGVDPFRVHNGVLGITAAPKDGLPNGLRYASGLITTKTTFEQVYGYFEMRAELPKGAGFWPAFWLLPADMSWPPEIDIVEMLGGDPTTYYGTVHSNATGVHTSIGSGGIAAPDLSAGYHTFGLSWRADEIRWYLNGKEVFSSPTPPDLVGKPMYLLANLAVGGQNSWPGPADGYTSGTMHIDYIRAYQFPDYVGYVPPPPTALYGNGTLAATMPGVTVGQVSYDGQAYMATVAGSVWNTIKTVQSAPSSWASSTAFRLAYDNFVEAKLDFSAAPTRIEILVIGAKRGAVTLGAGNDSFTWVTHSNDPTGGNTMKIAAGEGDDTVLVTASSLSTLDAKHDQGNGALWKPDYDGHLSVAEVTLSSGYDTVRAEGRVTLLAHGGSGWNVMIGANANDTLFAGTGGGDMTGGKGKDCFVFARGTGHYTIWDFTPDTDRIRLADLTDGTTVATRAASVDGVQGTLVTYGIQGDQVFLAMVSKLAASDLVFG